MTDATDRKQILWGLKGKKWAMSEISTVYYKVSEERKGLNFPLNSKHKNLIYVTRSKLLRGILFCNPETLKVPFRAEIEH